MSLHRLFRLKPALAGFLLVLIVAPVFAAGDFIPAGQPIPQNIRWVDATATGANTSAYATIGNVGSKFPVPVGSATLGGLLKTGLKKALPAAAWYQVAKGLVDGAGWAISELQDQVIDPGVPAEPLSNTTVSWCVNGGTFVGFPNARYCATTPDQVCAFFMGASVVGMNPSPVVIGCDHRSANDVRVKLSNTGDISIARLVITTQLAVTTTNINPSTETQVVTNQQLGDLVKYNPQVVNAILIDPDTGAPIRTQELVDALNALAAANALANGLDPPPLLQPDTSLGEGTTPSQTTAGEWPGFCDWATTVCDFIDWVKADDAPSEPVEVPFEELPMPNVEWSSGLGSGSCPAPYSTTVALGGYSQTVEFSVEPICDLGETMHNLVIALALLLSPMIIGGFRSSKDA